MANISVLSTVPAAGAQNVKLAPAVIEIAFSEKMNRDLTETAISVSPATGNVFFRWEQRFRKVGTGGTLPSLVYFDVLQIAFTTPLQAWTSYTVTVDKTKAKSHINEVLATNFVLSFKTRAQGVHLAPSDAVGGASRNNIPAGGYKRAIVLSGGGAKGDFQVGALKYLYNVERFFPDMVVGTSVGAINGAKLAEATTEAEHIATVTALESMWRSIRLDEEIYEKTPAYLNLLKELKEEKRSTGGIGFHTSTWEDILSVFGGPVLLDELEDAIEAIMVKTDEVRKASGMYSLEALRRNWLVAPKLDAGKVFASKVELHLGAVEMHSGRSEWLAKSGMANNALNLQNAILASAVMPGVFESMKIGTKVYTDGGVKDVAGLAKALSSGATDIVVIPTYPRGGWVHQPRLNANRYGTLEAVLGRALTELVFDEMLATDLSASIDRETLRNHYAGTDIRIRVIEPALEFHGSLSFHPEGIARGIDHGYDIAKVTLTGSGPRQAVPHPVEQSRTACYMVVNPKWPNGTPLKDWRTRHAYTGGLSEPLSTGGFEDVRIIIREGGKVVHTYPSDQFWDYSSIIVPGSDPELASPLNPYLNGVRKGMYYAFPLHPYNECVGVNVSSSARPTNLEVEVIYSTVFDKTYREARSKTNVTFAPNADGLMVHNVTMPATPAGNKSRRVRLFTKREGGKLMSPPCLTIHGAGEVPDVLTLIGTDGLLGTKGRWESSREMKFMPALKTIDVIADDVTVTFYSGPNYTGQSATINTDKTWDSAFTIRSLKVTLR